MDHVAVLSAVGGVVGVVVGAAAGRVTSGVTIVYPQWAMLGGILFAALALVEEVGLRVFGT